MPADKDITAESHAFVRPEQRIGCSIEEDASCDGNPGGNPDCVSFVVVVLELATPWLGARSVELPDHFKELGREKNVAIYHYSFSFVVLVAFVRTTSAWILALVHGAPDSVRM